MDTHILDLLPPLMPGDASTLGVGDVFVHAPGFEDRSLAFADLLRHSAGASAVLLDYRPALATNCLDRTRAVLAERSIRVEADDLLVYHRFEPNGFEGRLSNRLTARSARRVILDISSMSKLAIMLVLGVCRSLGLHVVVQYAEAAEYGPTRDEFESARAEGHIHRPSLQVYTGVHGVVRVDSLKSVAMQGSPTAALVFMSLNDALTQVLLNTVYPSRLLLINGRPPQHQWREEATAWIHDQVRKEWDADNPLAAATDTRPALPSRTVSTLDYRETVTLLLELYWQLWSRHRVLLAPAGSKMQTVGSFLAKALHPDIHVEYPSPEGFLPEYSKGIGRVWQLDLGDVRALVSRLAESESRRYLEIHEGAVTASASRGESPIPKE